MARCPVIANCLASTHCPFCVDGSEYQPIDRKIVFPTQAARIAARKEWRKSMAFRNGRGNARKGRQGEREVARLFGGQRVPMSGILDGLPNDNVLPNGWRVETKRRKSGLTRLYTRLTRGDVDVLIVEDEDGPPLVVAPRTIWDLLGSPPSLKGVRWARVVWAGGTKTIRRWLSAEQADAVLFRADRRDWLVIFEASRLAREEEVAGGRA